MTHRQIDGIQEWFEQLFPLHEAGWITIFSVAANGDRRTRWARTPEAAASAVTDLAPTGDVWFGVAPRRERLPGAQRGRVEHCLGVGALWLDLDVASGVHAGDRRDFATVGEAIEFANSFPVAPTALVTTGGGLHAWWVLADLVEKDEALPLLTRWATTWQRRAEAAGVELDNVWDLPRVMRVPGTFNRKGGRVEPVRLMEASWERRYGLDDLEPYLDVAPELPPQQERRSLPYVGSERPGDAFNAARRGGDVLAAAGWTPGHRHRNGDEDWLHPWGPEGDKSATVYADDGHTTIWSSTVPQHCPAVKTFRPYDRFGLYTVLLHDGDWRAARETLAAQGYGSRGMRDDDLSWAFTGDRMNGKGPENMPGNMPAPEPWPDPFWPGQHAELPPFPLHVLASWIADHCRAVSDRLQVPIDLCAQLAIGALAAVTAGRVDVEVTEGWREPICLFLVTAMTSGAGKSPADKAMVAPLRRLEDELMSLAAEQVARAEQERKVLERKVAKAEQAAAGSDSGDMGEAWDALNALINAETPASPRLLVSDATPEVLVQLLDRHEGRLAIVTTEAELFDMVCGAYAGRAGKVNLNVYLKGWDGGDLIVDRKGGSGSAPTQIRLPAIFLTVATTVQPSVLQGLAAHPELAGRGFTARFMYSLPGDLRGQRDRQRVLHRGPIATQASYEEMFLAIGRRVTSWSARAIVGFTKEAAEHYVDWMQGLEYRIGPDGDLRPLSEWTSKLTGSVARLAGLLHLADGRTPSPTDPLGAETMARAIAVGEYWIAHAMAVGALWSDDKRVAEVERILGWLRSRDGLEFTARDMHRRFERTYTRVVELRPVLDLLVEWGWIRPQSGTKYELGKPRVPSPVFDVHPSVHMVSTVSTGLSTGTVCTVGSVPYRDNSSTTTTTTPSPCPPYPPDSADTADTGGSRGVFTDSDNPPDPVGATDLTGLFDDDPPQGAA